MQLTVEFENADQIAAIAHLSQIMAMAGKSDELGMVTLYPPDVMQAINKMMDALEDALSYMDSPFSFQTKMANLLGQLVSKCKKSVSKYWKWKNFPIHLFQKINNHLIMEVVKVCQKDLFSS
jgi:hypothetical protein